MKKVILSICVVAIIAIAAVNVNLSLQKDNGSFSDLTLKNIQALGQYEGGPSGGGSNGCGTQAWNIGGQYWFECVTGTSTSCLQGNLLSGVSTIQCN
jgi:hypothetical protein